MGLFGNSSPFDADVEKATSEKNTSEDWAHIMDICDKVGTSTTNAKDCLRSIVKRLGNPDPHIVVQAITLLDACVNNCGRNFHLEIASREFETEYRKLLSRAQPPVAQKFKSLLKKWTDGEFKSDPQLNLIPSLMTKLKSEGVDFSDVSDMPSKKKDYSSRSSTASSATLLAQKEQDDIERAIELSLQESKQSSPRNSASASSASALYPTMSQLNTSVPVQEVYKVRALYDFEAAEDNELTFFAGEIIHVSDSSDPNWWKGYNQRGEGLFPANFVTTDLSVEPQNQKQNEKKSVQFNESVEVKSIERSNSPDSEEPVEINEGKIDRLLSLLHEANPEDSSTDTQEMLCLEGEVNKMGPLIDMELEKIDRKHAHLTQLSADLVDALNLYHTLMREPAHLKQPHATYPQPLPHMMYNGTSGYGNMSSMPSFYTQTQPPSSAAPPGTVMGSHPGMPSGMPPHMGMPHGMLPHQTQQIGTVQMTALPHMSSMPHMPTSVPSHVVAAQLATPNPYGSVSQASGGPASGIYHPAPPGPPHSFVM